jgi:hypothetical protein
MSSNNYDERLNGKRECTVVARDETKFWTTGNQEEVKKNHVMPSKYME